MKVVPQRRFDLRPAIPALTGIGWPILLPIVLLAAVVYFGGLTRWSFDPGHHTYYDLVFNDMLLRLQRGDFTINPQYICDEVYVANGKPYAYFGPFAALARLPFAAIVDLRSVPISAITCLVAALLAAGFNIASLCTVVAKTRPLVRIALGLALTFGGIPYTLTGSPVIFSEPILWADMLAAAHVFFLCRSFKSGAPSVGQLVGLAATAGLCLFARASTGLGLCVSATLVTAYFALSSAASFSDLIRKCLRYATPGAVIIALSFLAVFYVNYRRWGDPFEFMNLARQTVFTRADPSIVTRLNAEGAFNILRTPFGLQYYFAPVWPKLQHIPSVSAWMARHFNGVEPTPCSIPLTDLPMFLLSLAGARAMFDGRTSRSIRLTVGLSAIGLLIPPLLILVHIYMAYRYRVEFDPLLHLLGFFGAFQLLGRPAAPASPRLGLVLGASACVAIAFSAWTLSKMQTWNGIWEGPQGGGARAVIASQCPPWAGHTAKGAPSA